jgi:hypothetical protein
MKLRLFLIAIAFATCIGGVFLYKKFFGSQQFSEKKVYIYSSKTPGVKEDIGFIRKSLKLYDIKRNQIIENPKETLNDSNIKIFFEQSQFDEAITQNDLSLKIAIRLNDNSEEENSKGVGVFIEDKTEALLELVESVIKQHVNCILIYDDNLDSIKQNILQFQELAKIKNINLKLCPLKSNRNIATVLKEEAHHINAAIIVASPLVMAESELIFEHFNAHKIPVFANHSGLIRGGALGGFDFDTQEIAHSIAEIASSFFKDQNNIRRDLLEELYPQLHLNMDIIAKLSLKLDSDLLDEAVTVGGIDL